MAPVSKWSLANPAYRILSWTGALFGLYVLLKLIPCVNWGCLCFWSIAVAVVVMEGMRDYLKIDPKGKAVLITGCDTGFGLHFAEHILTKGFTVFAGVYDGESDGAKYLKQLCPERLFVVKLDVTSDKDTQEAVAVVTKTTQERKLVLWAVVNNAGVARAGPFEFLPAEDYDLPFQVNVVGTMRVSKMFLPLMRRSKGRFVNVTSVIRVAGGPIATPYTVSKFAAEGLAQCMSYELQHMGVRVVKVEPSFFVKCTNHVQSMLMDRRVEEARRRRTEEQSHYYDDKYFSRLREFQAMIASCGPASDALVMEVLERGVCSRYPASKYLAIDFLGVMMYFMSFLPETISRKLYAGE